MERQEYIKQLLTQSSEIALRYFGNVHATTKPEDNNQVLTDADLAIGRFVISAIQECYPDHNIIDEEAGVIDRGSKFTWVIDPIDGTSNFAAGVPTYGTIIGLLENDIPIAGGVSLPSFSEIYVAEKGKGTFGDGEKLHVTNETRLLSSLVAYCIDGHQEEPELTRQESRMLSELILNIRNLRASGSVYDGIMVAQGKYGAYLTCTGKIWDNVGLQVIIEEAGGVYTDFFGKPMDYSNALARTKENFTFCMAAPQLYTEIQKIIFPFKELGWRTA